MITKFQHELHEWAGSEYDIGVIELAEPADLSDPSVEVACLPDADAEFFYDAAECWVSGWGITECKYFISH